MADAYDIMAMAKRSGAAVQQKEDWEKYQDELARYKKKQGKAGFFGGLGSLALGLLMPAAIPALAGGGLGALLGTGAARGLTQFAGGEAIRSLFGGKEGQPTYKGTSTGPYGRAGAKAQQRQADMISRSIKEELEGGQRGRMFTSALSGFAPEIKSGAYKKEFADMDIFGLKEKMQDKTWLKGVQDNPWLVEGFEPYELEKFQELTKPGFFQSIGADISRGLRGRETIAPKKLSETAKLFSEQPDELLSYLSGSDKWTGYRPNEPYRPSYYKSELSLLDKILESSNRGRIQ